MTTSTTTVYVVSALSVYLFAQPLIAAAPAFSDQTISAGLQTTHTFLAPGAYYRMLSGGAVGDFNNDGFQDLFVMSGGVVPDRLFINDGAGGFTDQAVAWGIDELHRGGVAAVGDYDNDGWLDLFVTSFAPDGANPGPGYNRLYHNNGNGTFTDVAASAGVNTSDPNQPNGLGAAFGDLDLDGDLDLYVSGWFPQSNISDPESLFNNGNHCYLNNGNGTFTDVSVAAGVDCTQTHGFSVCFADMDGDRFPELMICGDFQSSRYFANNANGSFTDVSILAGVDPDPATNAMGMALGDVNRDGLMDWYITSITGNRLFINQGGNTYSEISQAAGVDQGGWGWGALMLDVNHDMHVDILETNGWNDYGCAGCEDYPNHPAYVWINNGNLTFTDAAAASGLIHTGQGRGMVSFDFDNDGDRDIVIFSWLEDLKLFRNDLSGPGANWLRVFLDTGANNRLAPNGYGTRVVATAGGVSQYTMITGGNSYLGVSELSAHFGLAANATIDELRIEWNNGVVTTLNNVAANQTLTIVAGRPGDVNGDGVVDTADLGILIAAFGSSSVIADVNGDGTVDTADLGLLIANFGM